MPGRNWDDERFAGQLPDFLGEAVRNYAQPLLREPLFRLPANQWESSKTSTKA